MGNTLSIPDISFVNVDAETAERAKQAVNQEAGDGLTMAEEILIIKAGGELPKPLCPAYRFDDETPLLCKCTKARQILGIKDYVCSPVEHCVVLVVINRHDRHDEPS